jgi:hypothetical protein
MMPQTIVLSDVIRNAFLLILLFALCSWGFYGHRKINRMAVFTLPPEMISFYKANINYIEEASVNPDKRRLAVPGEAPRHYIDLDVYKKPLPTNWKDALEKYSNDSLQAHGILPWHIYRMYFELKDAFIVKDPEKILRLSADLGHYIGDAHVPLHTTKNYDGQFTNQIGIHGFWESRLPELFGNHYHLFTGKAVYLNNVQLEAWRAVMQSHLAVDSVLRLEYELSYQWGEKKFGFESKGKQTIKVYTEAYAKAYHDLLQHMVEKQMRSAIQMTGSVWYTAWVDAGQPDIKSLITYKPSAEVIQRRKDELKKWKDEQRAAIRNHEDEN